MKTNSTRRLVFTALFTALFCVATLVIHIPSPIGGYLNAGDALILPSAFFLGPVFGSLSAGIGSALADIISGYAIYAPATFVIKFLMAMVAALLLRAFSEKRWFVGGLLGSVAAECIMVGGYFVYAALALGFGAAAVVDIVPNCMQGVFGIIVGMLLTGALRKASQRWKLI